MKKRSFDIIENEIKPILFKNGFAQKEKNENSSLFINHDSAYQLKYNEGTKCYELLSGSIEDHTAGQFKIISTWLFDPSQDTEKEAKSIARDFAETLQGSKSKKNKQTASAKKKNDEDRTVNPLFLMNRLAGIFPELKKDILDEKQSYTKFRSATFAREKALVYVKPVLENMTPKDKFLKLCELFSNIYNTGDFDTRSIITIIFLNSVDNNESISKIEEKISPELKDVWACTRKLKGKKIKPEKRKKAKRNLFAETLAASK